MKVNRNYISAVALIFLCKSTAIFAAPSKNLTSSISDRWRTCSTLTSSTFKDKDVNIIGIFVGRDMLNLDLSANDRIFVKIEDPTTGVNYWTAMYSSASSEIGRAQLDMLRFIYQQQVPIRFTCDSITADTIDSVAMDPGVN